MIEKVQYEVPQYHTLVQSKNKTQKSEKEPPTSWSYFWSAMEYRLLNRAIFGRL
jgi:hypothetical protein